MSGSIKTGGIERNSRVMQLKRRSKIILSRSDMISQMPLFSNFQTLYSRS